MAWIDEDDELMRTAWDLNRVNIVNMQVVIAVSAELSMTNLED